MEDWILLFSVSSSSLLSQMAVYCSMFLCCSPYLVGYFYFTHHLKLFQVFAELVELQPHAVETTLFHQLHPKHTSVSQVLGAQILDLKKCSRYVRCSWKNNVREAQFAKGLFYFRVFTLLYGCYNFPIFLTRW